MENDKKISYEEPMLDVTSELEDVLTTSGDKPLVKPDSDGYGWT